MAEPTTWAAVHTALLERRSLAITYHGLNRLICPHALGWKGNRLMVLGYQIGGQTTARTLDPDPNKRWRCMYIDEIDHLQPDNAGWQTADNYDPQRPFPAIDHLVAATAAQTPTVQGSTQAPNPA